jgi:tetratricopeptide (TPR) repeat protein
MDKFVSITWWRGIFVRYGQGLAGFLCIVMVIGFGWNQFGSGNNRNAGQSSPEKVVLKINGEPITQSEIMQVARNLSSADAKPGTQFAALQGEILKRVIDSTVIAQVAKKRGVHTSAAEVDQQIDALRDKAGLKKASDSDWENYLQQHMGVTVADLRDEVASDPALLFNALLQNYKNGLHVSDADVRNQNQQAKLDVVLIPFGQSRFMPTPKGQKQLTEAEAKQKAENLLAKVKGGADLTTIAKANSSDPSASKGGEIEYRPEYKVDPQMAAMGDMFGALGFGKDFDEAVHATAVGQLTPVVKAGGFSQGFIFAKVADRRNETPKDFNPKKAIEDLKTEQAKKKVTDDLTAQVKAAKLDWLDPDKKVYYDQSRLQPDQMEMVRDQFSGKTTGTTSQNALAQKQEALDAEWEDMLKRHPDDSTAMLMVSEAITSRKRYAKGTTAAQSNEYRKRLIDLYTGVLKTNEDRDIRFSLADLLAEQKDYAKAGEQYTTIAKFMAQDPPYNAATMQNYQTYYQRLAADFSKIGQADQAAKMQKEADDLKPQIAAKTAEERAQQAAQSGAGGMSPQFAPQSGAPVVPAPSAPGKAIGVPKQGVKR